MARTKLLRATACAILFTFLPACSALFVTGPDPSTMPYRAPVKCTSAPAAPMLDTVIAAAGIALAIAGSRAMNDDRDAGNSVGTMGLAAGTMIALGFGGSAYAGFDQVYDCHEAQAQAAKARTAEAQVTRGQATDLP
jgi:hypothetical protein